MKILGFCCCCCCWSCWCCKKISACYVNRKIISPFERENNVQWGTYPSTVSATKCKIYSGESAHTHIYTRKHMHTRAKIKPVSKMGMAFVVKNFVLDLTHWLNFGKPLFSRQRFPHCTKRGIVIISEASLKGNTEGAEQLLYPQSDRLRVVSN